MPDQLFRSLTEDVTARPLPAAEVRRRGDRRRRRQQVGIVAASVAAVAAVVLPVTLAHGSSDRLLPPTAPSSATVTTVPAGFPLTDGMPARDGATGKPLEAGPLTTEEEKACGNVVWSAQRPIPTVGGASVEYHDESEGGLSRSLALYADAEDAQKALRSIDLALTTCRTVDGGSGAVEVLSSATATDPTEIWLVRWTGKKGHPTGEGTVGSVTRVGNALLLDSATFLSAGSDEIVKQETNRLADRSAAVVASMCVFSSEPCAVAHDTSGSSASPDSSRPAADVLGPTGYDQLTIGMSYDDALATGDIETAAVDGGRGLQVVGHPDAGLCLSRKDGLMAIFLGKGMQTPEGIKLGSTADDLIAAYPDLRPYGPDSKVGGPGIFRAGAGDGDWYEIDVEPTLKVSNVILRQDHQTCFE